MSDAEKGPTAIFQVGSSNQALGISVVTFMSIALYNAVELAVLIPLSFRRYRSLYFWALLTSSTVGVIPATLGPTFQYFSMTPLWLAVLLSNLGFVMMVPNQSIVLYSRLHLVSQNLRLLRFVRWLIILSIFAIIIPTVILNVGSSYVPTTRWVRGFQVMERTQLTWFSTQETLISTIYIYDTIRIIRLGPSGDKRRHKILYELLAVNVIAIAMDIALVALEYLGFYFTQVILKAMVYSIKLKLEFAVLGMLVSLVNARGSQQVNWQAECTSSGYS
ncbi:uncharacterized protein N7498_003003 [Penicillium cinerascens]|uniref:DUF7703 domain-containing protein n=1 Tax=Penicillium cinerascens TaxID=70096 RepID=A0A9W9NB43_9EURO|nr:uncharacterized protein N7498_003003 [Penicillium cinerascens]KAJ5216596.1 hypothetical protein N7498_003003 [Penicillium cinerascens]